MSEHIITAGGSGLVLSLIATGRARSRAELVTRTGFSRTTVAQHLNVLFAAGLVREAPETERSGGRPARLLEIDTDFAIVLAADVGETHVRLAVTDLTPRILVEASLKIDLRDGPVAVLAAIAEQFHDLLSQSGHKIDSVLGLGLALPAPVDYAAGRVVGPSVMTGWDDFDIGDCMAAHLRVPILVENDVNLMTLCEFRAFWPHVGQLLFVKAGTGIGSGIIADGNLYRGAQGAAGDIGHIQLDGNDQPICRCGKLGCLEAHAAGWAIARALRSSGTEAQTASNVVDLAKGGHVDAIRLVRAAGRALGEVVASVVSVLNPSVIVIGGTLAEAGEDLLSGVRELVPRRSLPLAIRQLRIVRANGGRDAGLLGASQLVIDVRLGPNHADETISVHSANRPRALPHGKNSPDIAQPADDDRKTSINRRLRVI